MYREHAADQQRIQPEQRQLAAIGAL